MAGICRTIDVNELYQRFQESKNLDRVLSEAAARLLENVYSLHDNSMLEGYEHGMDGIFMMLINRKENKELLEVVQHRDVGDNALIYRYAVGKTESSIDSFIITNSFSKEYGVKEDGLFAFACVNTPKLFAPRIRTAKDLIEEFCEESRMPPKMTEHIVMAVTRGG